MSQAITDIQAALQQAQALRDFGRIADAAQLCAQVVAAAPRHPGARYLAGLLALREGRFQAAEAALREAVRLAPGMAGAHLNLGLTLRRLGRPADAILSYDQALQLQPANVEALNCRGVALLDLKRHDEAVAAFDAAIAASPALGVAHANRGLALLEAGRPAEALSSLDAAIALGAASPDVHFNRGNALLTLRRADEAVDSYDIVLGASLGDARVLANRATALFMAARLDEALTSSDQAIARSPEDPMLWFGRANILSQLGRYAEAIEVFDRVALARPEFGQAVNNRACARLALGDFEEGWRDFEARWRTPDFLRDSAGSSAGALRSHFDLSATVDDLRGRRVLVVTEQGVGDIIMFASLLPDLVAIAGKVTLVCSSRFVRLFAQSFPDIDVRERLVFEGKGGAYDVVVPIGSLARLFRNAREDFPGLPYLSAAPEVRARWGARLDQETRPRIGVSWRGGLAQTRRRERSLSLAALRPILDLPDCTFVSLQYGDVGAEIDAENATRTRPIVSFPPADTNDFEDLAALVQSLDMVVSVQTAVVHLAGAVGVPCLVMTPAEPEWRYAAAAPDLLWYRSVKVLRQARAGDWTSLVEAAARMVAEQVADLPRR